MNKHSTLLAIDKFNYLKALLEGPTASAIQGLSLSESNYSAALELLQQHSGQTQQIISAYMDELLKVSCCSVHMAAQLRAVYDKINVNVREMAAIEVTADQYGSF